jgi:hypothetical protein
LVSGTAAIVGDPLRRPGESAHCVLLEPSRRKELVRGSSGERGLDVLGVDASLHSDPEGEPAEADGAMRPGVSVTPVGLAGRLADLPGVRVVFGEAAMMPAERPPIFGEVVSEGCRW